MTIEDRPPPPQNNSAKTTTPEEDDKPKVVSRQKKKSQKRRMTDSEVITELSKLMYSLLSVIEQGVEGIKEWKLDNFFLVCL